MNLLYNSPIPSSVCHLSLPAYGPVQHVTRPGALRRGWFGKTISSKTNTSDIKSRCCAPRIKSTLIERHDPSQTSPLVALPCATTSPISYASLRRMPESTLHVRFVARGQGGSVCCASNYDDILHHDFSNYCARRLQAARTRNKHIYGITARGCGYTPGTLYMVPRRSEWCTTRLTV